MQRRVTPSRDACISSHRAHIASRASGALVPRAWDQLTALRRSVASREPSASIGWTVFIARDKCSQMSSHVAGTRAAARSIPGHFALSMPGMRVTGRWSPLSDTILESLEVTLRTSGLLCSIVRIALRAAVRSRG